MNASFRPIHFVAFLLVASGSLRADENAVNLKANKSELAKLQGSWTIVSFSQAGREFDARGLDEISKLGLVFEIKDDALAITSNGNVVENMKAILRLNANYNPKLLDFAESVKAFNDGEGVFEGVYSLEGDSLLWCVNVEGDHPVKGKRPTAFESKPDSSAIVVKFAPEELSDGGTTVRAGSVFLATSSGKRAEAIGFFQPSAMKPPLPGRFADSRLSRQIPTGELSIIGRTRTMVL